MSTIRYPKPLSAILRVNMKTLKFTHDLAQRILKGEKSSTWRLYDDKDLSVNDTIKVLDKVDPDRPETWQIIGLATINSVIQKRLGDISTEDFEGNGAEISKQNLLEKYRRHYGPQVDLDTPVKIIRFTFDNSIVVTGEGVVDKSTLLSEVNLYCDGGSRGNPGPSASGFAILDMGRNVVVKKGIYLGVTTNNQAEYQSLKFGLEEALAMRARTVHVYMDSLLVINQMKGIFKVKNRDLWPIHESIKELCRKFEQVIFTHVPRELNKLADGAVNESLDEAAKQHGH